MQVDFDYLRERIIRNFNHLVAIVNRSEFQGEIVMLDAVYLKTSIDALRDDIVTLSAIVNPESGKYIECDISSLETEGE